MAAYAHFLVIAGLDPAIHGCRKLDARVKPGHDKREVSAAGKRIRASESLLGQ
ncbi:MAG: hypothetical protein U1E53_15890 [Dongiaceae bacterium]